MTASSRQPQRLRHVFLTLAALALLLKVLVPPGFMAAPGPAAAFPLVLCTDHGAVQIDAAGRTIDGGAKKAPSERSSHDGPCVFAGHGTAGDAPNPFSASAVQFVAYRAAAPLAAPRDLAPGRGLAAPPLPARGPPIQLT